MPVQGQEGSQSVLFDCVQLASRSSTQILSPPPTLVQTHLLQTELQGQGVVVDVVVVVDVPVVVEVVVVVVVLVVVVVVSQPT